MKFLGSIKHVYVQVLVAVVIAIIFATIFPTQAQLMKPLGDGFIKLVKMVIVPIIFCTVFTGIVGGDNLKKVAMVGVKTFIYFEIVTTIALIIGLIVALVLKPGVGVDISALNISQISQYQHSKPITISNFLLNIIPNTLFEPFVKDNILSLLFITILISIALFRIKDEIKTIIKIVEELSKVLFRVLKIIMKFAPIGAFGAMSYAVGQYGVSALLLLLKLMGCFYLTCILFVFLVLGLILRLCGSNIIKLLRHIKEEIFLVIGTSSSESVLPSLMLKMEKFGCSKSIVGLVVPTGYSFNLDGTCIYFTMAIIFIAQAYGVDLTLIQIVTIIMVLLIASKGAAGVTGSGFITLAATLSVINTVPIEGLALILGIDRFMSEARAVTNLIGNATATIVISRLEQEKNDQSGRLFKSILKKIKNV
jgi:aerobic C4-dicarboxylate transport protein